jgi:hypothetical protein
MSAKKTKKARKHHRWTAWDAGTLEPRLMMSAVPLAAEVSLTRVDRSAEGAPSPTAHLPQWSQATRLILTNNTNRAVRIGVSDINDSDWDGYDRPDNNLDGAVLAPGRTLDAREEINVWSNPQFTITLYDEATGAQIVTARASFRTLSLRPPYSSWTLSPDSSRAYNDGQALRFYWRSDKQNTGRFVLDPVSASPRKGLAPSHPAPGRLDVGMATRVILTNNTNRAVRIGISGIDDSDWDGYDRPDNNLDGVVLAPGRTIDAREEINAWSNPNFTITLYDEATGAQIVTARASFGALWVDPPYFAWTLSPDSSRAYNDGQVLRFYWRSDKTDTGRFVLQPVSASPRRALPRPTPSTVGWTPARRPT